MIRVTSTSDRNIPLRTEGCAEQCPLSYLLPQVMGVCCIPGKVIELFCFQRNSTSLKAFPKVTDWSMSSDWMCLIKIDQSCKGKLPFLSYSRKFSHGIGNITAQKMKDMEFWPQRNLFCFFTWKMWCYERYFNKWRFFLSVKFQFFIRNICLEVFSLTLFTCTAGAYGKWTEACLLFSLPSPVCLISPSYPITWLAITGPWEVIFLATAHQVLGSPMHGSFLWTCSWPSPKTLLFLLHLELAVWFLL